MVFIHVLLSNIYIYIKKKFVVVVSYVLFVNNKIFLKFIKNENNMN